MIPFECLNVVIKLHTQVGKFLKLFRKIEVSEEKARNFGVEASSKVHNLGFIIEREICM